MERNLRPDQIFVLQTEEKQNTLIPIEMTCQINGHVRKRSIGIKWTSGLVMIES